MNSSTQQWYDALVSASGTKQRKLHDQSITLVRFTAEPGDATAAGFIEQELRRLEASPLSFDVNFVVPIDQVSLIATDRVADAMRDLAVMQVPSVAATHVPEILHN